MDNDSGRYATLEFTRPEEGLGIIRLNRPAKLNALSLDMLEDLAALFSRLMQDAATRVVILTGAGRGFCSGADLTDERIQREAGELFGDPMRHLRLLQKKYAAVVLGLRRIPQPVIAAVNGHAAGGGMSMALAADACLVSEHAAFTPSFINIGLSGGELGTTFFLPRAVGHVRASEILMTGRTVGAREAVAMGMASRMTAPEKLLDEALALARMMLAKNPAGLAMTKEALNLNLTAPSLEAAIELENRTQSLLCFTKEHHEMAGAFANRKKT